jgi:uncharacterized protein DUF4440
VFRTNTISYPKLLTQQPVASELPMNHDLLNHDLPNHDLLNHDLPNHDLLNHDLPNHQSSPARKRFLAGASLLLALAILLGPANSQTQHKNDARSGAPTSVQLELVRIETGFFEAWKTNDQAYFREHMPENGIFWSDSGTLSRDQQLAAQQASGKTCTVEGYGLSDFGALPLATGAYLLTYKAEQYATCNGEKLPVHLNGSSIYILKAGHWQAIYRAQVPLKTPGQGIRIE